MANERDDENFGEQNDQRNDPRDSGGMGESSTGSGGSTGQGGTSEYGAQGQSGGQSETAFADPDGQQSGQAGGIEGSGDMSGQAGSASSGFVGSQSEGSDEYLRQQGGSGEQNFAEQGRGATDDEDESGDSGNSGSF